MYPQLNPVSFSQSSSDKPSLAMRPPFLFWESYPAVQIWRRIWQTFVERLSTRFLTQFYLHSNSQWYSELPKPQPSGEQIGCFLVSLLCCQGFGSLGYDDHILTALPFASHFPKFCCCFLASHFRCPVGLYHFCRCV